MHDVCSSTNQLEQRGSLKRQARFVLQSMIFLLHRFQAPVSTTSVERSCWTWQFDPARGFWKWGLPVALKAPTIPNSPILRRSFHETNQPWGVPMETNQLQAASLRAPDLEEMKESVSQIRKAYHQVGRRACGGLDPTGMKAEDFEIFGSGYIRMIQDVCRKPWIRHWIKHCHSEEKHIYFFWSGCILVFFLCCTCFGERERERPNRQLPWCFWCEAREGCAIHKWSLGLKKSVGDIWGPERWGLRLWKQNTHGIPKIQGFIDFIIIIIIFVFFAFKQQFFAKFSTSTCVGLSG